MKITYNKQIYYVDNVYRCVGARIVGISDQSIVVCDDKTKEEYSIRKENAFETKQSAISAKIESIKKEIKNDQKNYSEYPMSYLRAQEMKKVVAEIEDKKDLIIFLESQITTNNQE